MRKQPVYQSMMWRIRTRVVPPIDGRKRSDKGASGRKSECPCEWLQRPRTLLAFAKGHVFLHFTRSHRLQPAIPRWHKWPHLTHQRSTTVSPAIMISIHNASPPFPSPRTMTFWQVPVPTVPWWSSTCRNTNQSCASTLRSHYLLRTSYGPTHVDSA